MSCREHLTQLRQYEEELEKKGVAVCVVTFDADFMARAYVEQTGLKWPLLIDTERKLYRAFSLIKGSWWSIINPVSIWKYLSLMFRGQRVQKSGEDFRQMGGDVLIDPDGHIQLHYVSHDPHDRPAVEDILEILGIESRA